MIINITLKTHGPFLDIVPQVYVVNVAQDSLVQRHNCLIGIFIKRHEPHTFSWSNPTKGGKTGQIFCKHKPCTWSKDKIYHKHINIKTLKLRMTKTDWERLLCLRYQDRQLVREWALKVQSKDETHTAFACLSKIACCILSNFCIFY